MSFCLPKEIADKLRPKMKEIGGANLSKMTFQELYEFFGNAVENDRTGLELAKTFKLALISTNKNSLQNWLKKTLTSEEVARYNKISEEKANVLDEYKKEKAKIEDDLKQKKITAKEAVERVKKLETESKKMTQDEKVKANIERLKTKLENLKNGVMPEKKQKREPTQEEMELYDQIDEEFKKLAGDTFEPIEEDIVKKALGVHISADEVAKINELAQRLYDVEQMEPDNDFFGVHSDFFKVQKELEEYIDTVSPMSNMSIVSSLIFRGNLLFGIKSIVTNIIGNTAGGISEKIVEAAIGGFQDKNITMGTNPELVKSYVKEALKIYLDTGIDSVRAMDTGKKSSTVLGEHIKTVGTGEGFLRSWGRFNQQYIFKYGQGTPDMAFAALHFATKLNVTTTKLAKAKGFTGEALKEEAARLFKLGTSLTLEENNVEHIDAYVLKQDAFQHALTATYQNDTELSKVLLNVRSSIDDYTGDLNLGTNLSPFVKTLVNITILSLDMSGITSTWNAPKLIIGIKNGDTKAVKEASRVLIRAGLGLVTAALIASSVDDDDYMPDYFMASDYQRDLAKTANIPYNAIRIGNKWVSLGYLGTFGYAITGFLAAKNKNTGLDKSWSFIKTVGFQLKETPVVSVLFDSYEYLTDSMKYNKDGGDIAGEALAGTANFFIARSIPAISSDIAKSFDDVERFSGYGLSGAFNQLKLRVPFWRETLPQKHNAFGEPIPVESWPSVILFGARVKSVPEDVKLYSELTRLSLTGNNVALDLKGRKDVKVVKSILSQNEFNEFQAMLQKNLAEEYRSILEKPSYQDEEDDAEKKDKLEKNISKIIDKTIKDYGVDDKVSQAEKILDQVSDKGEVDEKEFITQVSMYAKAMGTDPVDAFDALFAGETIRRIDNGAIIVHRMGVSESQDVKEEWGGNVEAMKLDHTIPLQLGGLNKEDNLKLVPTDVWKSYTPVENYLGGLLRKDKISKKDAQNAIKSFKEGSKTFNEIKSELGE